MDREAARRRAAACFAVARSATLPGEREAAIGRGKALATAAGLSLDLFDIPGRTKAQPDQRAADRRAFDDMAARFGTDDPAEALRRLREELEATYGASVTISVGDSVEQLLATLERRAAETGARPDETVYDARRRNFDAATAAARQRDANRARR